MSGLDRARASALNSPPDLGEATRMYRVHKTRRKDRDRAWVLRWTDPPASARLKQKTIGAMSAGMAERHRQMWQAELNGLLDAEEAPMTWDDFVSAYLAAKTPELALASVRSARHILASFGDVCRPRLLCDVDRAMVERYKVERLKTRAMATAKKEIRTLKAAVAWAVEVGHVQFALGANPFLVRFGRREAQDVDAYVPEEAERLLAAAQQAPVWVEASVRLAVRWGLRIGELAALERADVDLAARLVHVRAKAHWMPKSGHSRAVPLDEKTGGLLQELSHRDGPILWGPRDAPQTSADGTRGYKRMLRLALRDLCQAAGLRVLAKPVHGLRATAYTNMRRRGVPQHYINLIIGHTSSAVGDAHYDATSFEEAARAAERIMGQQQDE